MNRRSLSKSSVRNSSPLRARLREAVSEAILTAAEEVFAEEGLHTAHVGHIATRAGVAVGTLYNHFQDRGALIEALLAAQRAELLGRLDAATEEAKRFEERLLALVQATFGYFSDHRQFFRILMQGELGGLRTWTEAMHEVYLRIDATMQTGVKEKVLRRANVELYPAILLGTMRSLFIREIFFGGKLPAPARVVDIFLHGAAL